MDKEVLLSQNLTITYGELDNWGYDDRDVVYPVMYMVGFSFFGKKFTGYFHPNSLKSPDDFDTTSLEGDSDLFDSMERQIQDGRWFDQICDYCKSIWKEECGECDCLAYNFKAEKTDEYERIASQYNL